MKDDISIVGIGACNALGIGSRQIAAAMVGGISGVRRHPRMINLDGDRMTFAQSPIDKNIRGSDRVFSLAVASLDDALRSWNDARNRTLNIQVWLALPETTLSWVEEIAVRLPSKLSDYGLPSESPRIHSGPLGWWRALQEATISIRDRTCELCVVMSLDTLLHRETLEKLDAAQTSLSRRNRWGCIPGEGAGACVLTTAPLASRCALPVLGTLQALSVVGTEKGPVHTGSLLSNAMRSVLRDDTAIEWSVCDLTGDRIQADAFGFVSTRLGLRKIGANDVWTPVDGWGEIGVASGPCMLAAGMSASVVANNEDSSGLVWSHSVEHGSAVALVRSHATSLRDKGVGRWT